MKPTDKNYKMLSDEIKLIWRDNKKMYDWCMKNIKRVTKINEDGDFIAFSNPTLETEFWFGYSDIGQGLSYDDNIKRMEKIRDSITKHFITENTRKFEEMIELLRDKNNEFYVTIKYMGGKHMMHVDQRPPFSREDISRLIDFDEREKIIDAYITELEKMTKRCVTWLKKYGTEKIKLRTYWIDR